MMTDDPSLANFNLGGMYPIDYSIHCWHYDILKLLLEHGADPNAGSFLDKCGDVERFRTLLIEYGAKT